MMGIKSFEYCLHLCEIFLVFSPSDTHLIFMLKSCWRLFLVLDEYIESKEHLNLKVPPIMDW